MKDIIELMENLDPYCDTIQGTISFLESQENFDYSLSKVV